MKDIIEQILANVDHRILIAIAVILVISFIFALVKKIAKLAIFIAAVAIIVTIGIPAAKDFQDKYQFNIVEGQAVVMIEGKKFILDKEECKNITIEMTEDKKYEMEAVISGNTVEVEIPSFMVKGIESFANSNGIPITVGE